MGSRRGICLLVSLLLAAGGLIGWHLAASAHAQQGDAPAGDPFGGSASEGDPFADPPMQDDLADDDPFADDEETVESSTQAKPPQSRLVLRRTPPEALRRRGRAEYAAGNYLAAFDALRELICRSGGAGEPDDVADDFSRAHRCLEKLGQYEQFDDLRAESVAAHPRNWRLLWEAAEWAMIAPHHGRKAGGRFLRGNKDSGVGVVNSLRRDRAQAVRWMVRAMDCMPEDVDRKVVHRFYTDLADMLLGGAGPQGVFWLVGRTDLRELPGYDEGRNLRGPSDVLPPAEEDGAPLFPREPASFESARSDAERWWWCLAQAKAANSGASDDWGRRVAEVLWKRYGVQTLREAMHEPGEGDAAAAARRQLHTLGQDETIARLAGGIRRFKLPPALNYIRIYQEMAVSEEKAERMAAAKALATIFENRRQYAKAVIFRKQQLREHGQAGRRSYLHRTIGNWGQLEPVGVQPAGRKATVQYRFRNGRSVRFTAKRIDIEKMVADQRVQAATGGLGLRGPVGAGLTRVVHSQPEVYLPSTAGTLGPGVLGQYLAGLGGYGYGYYEDHLLRKHVARYLGPEVASWHLALEPRHGHLDRRVDVTTPLDKAGAYLLTARMSRGNTSSMIVWLAELAVVDVSGESKYAVFVADPLTGEPVARADVQFRVPSVGRFGPHLWKVTSRKTDADGLAAFDVGDGATGDTPLVTARAPDGRFGLLDSAYPGGYWHAGGLGGGVARDRDAAAKKIYAITDRPVYRPGQMVCYKFWVRSVGRGGEDRSHYAYRFFTVTLSNPKNEVLLKRRVQADAFGGIDGQFELPPDAALGVYRWKVQGRSERRRSVRSTGYRTPVVQEMSGGTFRVEEYKKPEFEVLVEAPDEPVMQGEKILAAIVARYYFGEPVRQARVRYKVTRQPQSQRPRVSDPWQWFYGPYYWSPAYHPWAEKPWFSRWNAGVSYGGQQPDPPEVVEEREVLIGTDGRVEIEIDTAAAKPAQTGEAFRYSVSAEVTDQSRRTIVGSGTVLVAQEPFSIAVTSDRGYWRTGEEVGVDLRAERADGRPVEATGHVRLLRTTGDGPEAKETEVDRWTVATNPQGSATLRVAASQPGRHRVVAVLHDRDGHSVTGEETVCVIWPGVGTGDCRVEGVELIADRRNYRPGEAVKLLVNAERAGATVLLSIGRAEGVEARVVRLEGRSKVVRIPVTAQDIPGFQVQALTVAGCAMAEASCAIAVPPAGRVLHVDVEPSAEEYQPGEKASVRMRLTDSSGEPVVASTVVAIYDRSIDYIAGETVEDQMRSFFWKDLADGGHTLARRSNLDYVFRQISGKRHMAMPRVGMFDETIPDDLGDPAARAEGSWMPRILFGPAGLQWGGYGGGYFGGAMGGGFGGMGGMGMGGGGGGFFGGPVGATKPKPKAAALVVPKIRKRFADTALWVGSLRTNADGMANVRVAMPENLTAWRIKVWAMGHGTAVGQAETDVVTRKDVIVRLQTPRFAVEQDEFVVSANVHNYLATAKEVRVGLELDGQQLQLLRPSPRQTVAIAPGGESRVDWRVVARWPGEAVLRVKAMTDEESDAIETRLPIQVHGMLRTESYCGAMEPDEAEKEVRFVVPPERPQQAKVELCLAPTVATAMIEALPYLADYPYGCTEQTLNRFLPSVIAQRVMRETGLEPEEITGRPVRGARRRSARSARFSSRRPVVDSREVARMVAAGVRRLAGKQCRDGGWGWFSGAGEHSDAHMTALVVHGLHVAEQNGVALPEKMLPAGVNWLLKYRDEQLARLNLPGDAEDRKERADNLDAMVHMVLVERGRASGQMTERLYADRRHLSVAGLAMFALALAQQNEADKLEMVQRNLEQYLVSDEQHFTVHLRTPDGAARWRWYGSDFAAQAYYLKLLARTDPLGERAAALAKYLLVERPNATHWRSTRDTALCVEAIGDYLVASGESQSEMKVEVWLDGQLQRTMDMTFENLLHKDARLRISGDGIGAGRHRLVLKKRGAGRIYYSASVATYTADEQIRAAGGDLKIQRRYFVVQRGEDAAEKPKRRPLADGESLRSGDLVEVELSVISRVDAEYVMIEDRKPAGFEPVDLRSGYNENELRAYMEIHDDRVALFVRRLSSGQHSVTYRMRAETPGRFRVLPAALSAMYAPELRGNSAGAPIRIEEGPAIPAASPDPPSPGGGFF